MRRHRLSIDRRTSFLALLLSLASVSGVARVVAEADQRVGLTILPRSLLFHSLLSATQVTASIVASIGVFMARPWGWWLGISYWLSEMARAAIHLVSVLLRMASQSTATGLRDVAFAAGILAAEAWIMPYFFEKGLDQAFGINLNLRPRQWLWLCGAVAGTIGLVFVLSIVFGH